MPFLFSLDNLCISPSYPASFLLLLLRDFCLYFKTIRSPGILRLPTVFTHLCFFWKVFFRDLLFSVFLRWCLFPPFNSVILFCKYRTLYQGFSLAQFSFLIVLRSGTQDRSRQTLTGQDPNAGIKGTQNWQGAESTVQNGACWLIKDRRHSSWI